MLLHRQRRGWLTWGAIIGRRSSPKHFDDHAGHAEAGGYDDNGYDDVVETNTLGLKVWLLARKQLLFT